MPLLLSLERMALSGFFKSVSVCDPKPIVRGFTSVRKLAFLSCNTNGSHRRGSALSCAATRLQKKLRSSQPCVGQPTLSNGTRASSTVALTSSTLSSLNRGPFSVVNDQDVQYFNKVLQGRVITDKDELEGYNTDWLKTVRGKLMYPTM